MKNSSSLTPYFCALFILVAVVSQSQAQSNLRRSLSNEFSGLASMWNETNLDEVVDIEGSPNLFPIWHIGDITTADGKVISGMRCNYNASENVFMIADVRTRQVYQLAQNEFVSFVYYDEKNRQHIVKKGSKETFEKQKADFFIYEELMDKSEVVIAKLTKKNLKVAGEFARAEYRSDSWTSSISYYYSVKGSKFKKLKVNKKGLTSVLPPAVMSQVEEYVNANDDVYWSSKKSIMNFISSTLK